MVGGLTEITLPTAWVLDCKPLPTVTPVVVVVDVTGVSLVWLAAKAAPPPIRLIAVAARKSLRIILTLLFAPLQGAGKTPAWAPVAPAAGSGPLSLLAGAGKLRLLA